MNRRDIAILVRSTVIFGATMMAAVLAARAEPLALNCTLVGRDRHVEDRHCRPRRDLEKRDRQDSGAERQCSFPRLARST